MRMSAASASAKPPPAARPHQRDDRLRAAPHQHHDVGDPALRIQRLRNIRRLLLPGAALHCLLEIQPGAECLSRALQHHHPGGAVALQALEIAVQRVDQRRIERVEVLRAIERHPVDPVLMFDQQRFGHAALLFLPLLGPGSAVHREERCTASGTRNLVPRMLRSAFGVALRARGALLIRGP